MQRFSPFVLFFVVLAIGCGENLPTPTPTPSFGPPTGLKALSVSQSTVKIQWLAITDTAVQSYIARVGSRIDTLPRVTSELTADSLSPGESAFFVYSLKTNGTRSDAATIRWAPAARFDSAFAVYERSSPTPVRPEGFNVGTSTTSPSVMIMNLNNPVVQQTMDLFFNGDSVETHQSLSMWSASLLRAPFNRTLFSTQTDASASLDLPLGIFPLESTFVKDSITVVDNTIYYARVIGDPLQVNYARIHVHIRQGTTVPNRIIEVRLSLQRVPGLLYAFRSEKDYEGFFHHLKLLSIINNTHS